MTQLKNEEFICFDCETTGLDPLNDQIIEIAVARFTFSGVQESFETLIDPQKNIPEESTKIHHITDDMVKGKPTIKESLPQILDLIGSHVVMGHGIPFDIAILKKAAEDHGFTHKLDKVKFIDTLRLARHYGQAPSNSLESLRHHFNIPEEGAHRAMNDVMVNIEVFKNLCTGFNSSKQVFQLLSKPVELKHMPLGKHKGRPFKEVPLEYLKWAVHKDFDQDLKYSLQKELNRRKRGGQFSQASNPFLSL